MKKSYVFLYPYQLNNELAPFEDSEIFKNTQFLLLALVVETLRRQNQNRESFINGILMS